MATVCFIEMPSLPDRKFVSNRFFVLFGFCNFANFMNRQSSIEQQSCHVDANFIGSQCNNWYFDISSFDSYDG
jgi:hypothetical protein